MMHDCVLPDEVSVVEVGPRDGLQNESKFVPTDTKLEFIRLLADAGLTHIESTSFVNPKAVPQLADAADLAGRLPGREGVTYSALVPNERGLEGAIESGIRRIAVFTAASDSFTKHNINMTVAESLTRFEQVIDRARTAGLTVRGYVSTAFVCPYEGEIDKGRVREVTTSLVEMGVDEVAISDTIGAAAPTDVRTTVGHVLETVPAERLALHFHDTYGTALANVYAGLELGIRTYDASAGGLGGCPFAPGAAGNLATEDLVYMLDRMNIRSGIDIARVVEAAGLMARALGRELCSRQLQRVRQAGNSC